MYVKYFSDLSHNYMHMFNHTVTTFCLDYTAEEKQLKIRETTDMPVRCMMCPVIIIIIIIIIIIVIICISRLPEQAQKPIELATIKQQNS